MELKETCERSCRGIGTERISEETREKARENAVF